MGSRKVYTGRTKIKEQRRWADRVSEDLLTYEVCNTAENHFVSLQNLQRLTIHVQDGYNFVSRITS